MRIHLLGLLAASLCAAPSAPPRYEGRVIRIVDGDTIHVLVDRNPVSVRLYGVDAPERNQPFGARARAFMSSLAFGKDVAVVVRGTDRNQRWVAEVILRDGRNVSEEILKSGYAWWFRRYAPNDRRLEKLEAEARRERRGLWNDPRPVAPWEWRHTRSVWRPWRQARRRLVLSDEIRES